MNYSSQFQIALIAAILNRERIKLVQNVQNRERIERAVMDFDGNNTNFGRNKIN